MAGMRDVMHQALGEAREMMGDVVGDLRADNVLTDDEVLARYEVHRFDPSAKLAFVQDRTGLAGDALMEEAVRYEREMEDLYRTQGV
jgi:hypothetical protein